MDEGQQETAARYVLGEMSLEEEAQFRAALESDPQLATFTRELTESFASLGLLAAPRAAPPSVPDAIVESVQLKPKVVPFVRVIPWAVAACLAVTSTLLALGLVRTYRESAGLENKNAEVARKLEDLRNKNNETAKEVGELQAETDQAKRELADLRDKNSALQNELDKLRVKDALSQIRIATLQARVASYAHAVATVVWNPETQSGVIQIDNFPTLKHGKDYQLWIIDPKAAQPISAGLVRVPGSGTLKVAFRPVSPVETAAKFAVSIENAGGSPVPRGEIVLIGQSSI
jgi:anti-sigma-K factor RskA